MTKPMKREPQQPTQEQQEEEEAKEKVRMHTCMKALTLHLLRCLCNSYSCGSTRVPLTHPASSYLPDRHLMSLRCRTQRPSVAPDTSHSPFTIHHVQHPPCLLSAITRTPCHECPPWSVSRVPSWIAAHAWTQAQAEPEIHVGLRIMKKPEAGSGSGAAAGAGGAAGGPAEAGRALGGAGGPAAAGRGGGAQRVAGVGDGGVSWRLKALKRAQEQAKAEGRSLSEVTRKGGERAVAWGAGRVPLPVVAPCALSYVPVISRNTVMSQRKAVIVRWGWWAVVAPVAPFVVM